MAEQIADMIRERMDDHQILAAASDNDGFGELARLILASMAKAGFSAEDIALHIGSLPDFIEAEMERRNRVRQV